MKWASLLLFFSVHTFAGQLPGQPTNLKATWIADNKIHLEWNDNSMNEQGFIVGSWGPDYVNSVQTPANTTSVDIELPVTPMTGTVYFFQVSAFTGSQGMVKSRVLDLIKPKTTNWNVSGKIIDAESLLPIMGVKVSMIGRRSLMSDTFEMTKEGIFTVTQKWPADAGVGANLPGGMSVHAIEGAIPSWCSFNLYNHGTGATYAFRDLRDGIPAGKWSLVLPYDSNESCQELGVRAIKFHYENPVIEGEVLSDATGTYSFSGVGSGTKEFWYKHPQYSIQSLNGENGAYKTVEQDVVVENMFGLLHN